MRSAALAVAFAAVACGLGPGVALGPGAAAAAPGPTLRPGAAEVSRPRAPDRGWRAFLARSRDLGPRESRPVQLLVELRGPGGALVRWAFAHSLHARLLGGEHVAVLAGSGRAIGAALGVEVDQYRAPDGRRFYAAARAARVPRPLRGAVASIGRISSYGRITSDYVPGSGLGPSGIVQAYDATALESASGAGRGETVVLFEVDGYRSADLRAYARSYRLPAFDVATVGANSTKGSETPMDMEVVHGIAGNARLVYFDLNSISSSNLAVVFEEAFAEAAKRYPGAIWSLSLGVCEDDFSASDLLAMNTAVANAERAGTSVFAASGDSGGLECLGYGGNAPAEGVQVPAVLPAVTGVGGTAISVSTSGAYLGETTWSEPLLSQGTGGGVSAVFARPAWQSTTGVEGAAAGVQGCAGSPGCREVPDVAAMADPLTGAAIYVGGRLVSGGGTSLATPIWAGFAALADAYLRAHGRPPIGDANPWLYRAAAGPVAHAAFHDVTLGGNDFYVARTGYDMATGLGSPDVWNLARDLAQLGA